MVYPHFKNKHLEKALTFANPRGVKKKVPKSCIIAYYHITFEHLLKRLGNKAKKVKSPNLWGCRAYATKDFMFVNMNGIGSPHAIVVFEELIALGVERFLLIGSAGGLKNPGFFVCDKAIRDEGTSHHYLKYSKYAYPDKEMTEKLSEFLKSKGVNYSFGTSWTVDAIYRETNKEINKYTKEGVSTVEMEASALFAVAQVKKVKIAAIFTVGDVLKKRWMHLPKRELRKNLRKLADLSIEFLELERDY